MDTYLEIAISATSERQRELLLPTMIELGCEGFQETDSALLCYVNRSRLRDERTLDQLKAIVRQISSNASVSVREIVNRNWNEEWERTIQPIEVGRRIAIKPTWASYENPAGRIVVQIDPKMSFGTGYHETTRLVLGLLEERVSESDIVFDMGTGTGILAIAAVKLGASRAVGIDNDEWSIANAAENVRLNNLVDRVAIENRAIGAFEPGSFTLITANLTLNTNVELLGEFHRLLTPNGSLLLSGLLVADRSRMVAELVQHSFDLQDERIENEWIAIAARRRQ